MILHIFLVLYVQYTALMFDFDLYAMRFGRSVQIGWVRRTKSAGHYVFPGDSFSTSFGYDLQPLRFLSEYRRRLRAGADINQFYV